MKKLFTILFFSMLPILVLAQKSKRHNEISVSYGILPSTKTINAFADIRNTNITLGNTETKNITSFGTVNIGYGFRTSKWLTIGATYTYSNLKKDVYISSTWSDGNYMGKENYNFHAIIPTAKFTWLNIKLKKIHFYSKVALGLCYINSKDAEKKKHNDFQMAFQLSPIGIEYGDAFSGFVEAGIGNMGTGQIGARYQF